jgi:hypothetical protein
MGNPTPSAAERDMASKVAGLLMSPPCARIDYTLNNNRISGSLYSFIALSIVSPNNKTTNVGVTVLPMPAGTEAQYNIQSNNLEVPNAAYGTTGFQKMTFVHESTHAALDARGSSFALPRLLNETIAYISGALFNVYSAANIAGPFSFTPTGGIYLEAHKLALKMRKNQDRFAGNWSYALYQYDIAALQTAIQTSPTYTGFFANPAATYSDDGVSL